MKPRQQVTNYAACRAATWLVGKQWAVAVVLVVCVCRAAGAFPLRGVQCMLHEHRCLVHAIGGMAGDHSNLLTCCVAGPALSQWHSEVPATGRASSWAVLAAAAALLLAAAVLQAR
jgi:hypothetical protein